MTYNVTKQSVDQDKEVIDTAESQEHGMYFLEDIKREAINSGHVVNIFGINNVVALHVKDHLGNEHIYQIEENEE